ncbi:MAG: hypothetical protein GX419_00320 [Bacteroidales bacterium]|nr:hypothetical protein [Bacteroidales bacterium]
MRIRRESELMRSGLALWDGIRVNPAETEWKRPLWRIAHQEGKRTDAQWVGLMGWHPG